MLASNSYVLHPENCTTFADFANFAQIRESLCREKFCIPQSAKVYVRMEIKKNIKLFFHMSNNLNTFFYKHTKAELCTQKLRENN